MAQSTGVRTEDQGLSSGYKLICNIELNLFSPLSSVPMFERLGTYVFLLFFLFKVG